MIHRYENDRNFRASFVAHMQKKCSPSVIIDDIDSVASLVKALPNLMVTGRDKTFKIVRLVSTEESRLANIIFSEMLDAISVFLRSHYKSNSLNPSYVICVSSERQYSSSRSRFYSLENDVSRWPENPLDIMSDNEDDYLDDFLLWVIYYLNDGILVFLLAMFVTLPFIIFAFYMLFSIQAPIRIGKME